MWLNTDQKPCTVDTVYTFFRLAWYSAAVAPLVALAIIL